MTALAIQPPLRMVRLYGKLGAKFGRIHYLALDSNSVAEAVQALCSQLKGLRTWLVQSHEHGVGYAVFAGKKNLAVEELRQPVGGEDIRIAPVLIGSKSGGVLNVIIGAVLVIVGAVIDIYFPEFSVLGDALIKFGAAMIVGGIVQMLAPHPKGLGSKDNPANTPSYAFNGPINTEAQGHPVPLFYGGPMWIGSAVISAGISVTDNSSAYAPPGSSAEGGGGGGGDQNRGLVAQR